ncbi:hypothetical protein HS125_13035 [bacterium]|nr:hypothetical protein [bacterium]
MDPSLRVFPDGSQEGYWGERYRMVAYDGGAYQEAVYLPYAGIHELAELDRSHFPSADWFDFSTLRQQCQVVRREFAVIFGTPGDLDFINGISRLRGMEQVLMDMADDGAGVYGDSGGALQFLL